MATKRTASNKVKSTPKNILLIEKSKTFSQLLERTLNAGGFGSIHCIPHFPALPKSRSAFDKVHALVIGSNVTDRAATAAFLESLNQSHPDLAICVIAHDQETIHKTPLPGEPEVITWSDFASLPRRLKKIMGSPVPNQLQARPGSVRILFVDDSYSVRFSYQKLLQENGYTVDVARNALDALKLAKKNSYDLAIVDYFLPDTNGDKLCAMLRQLDGSEHLQIALLTATYRDEIIKSSLEAGAIECMFKNEAKELFLARIASLARHAQTQKGLLESKQELLHVLQSVHDVILGVNRQGKIAFFNKQAKEAIGKNVRLLGVPFNKVISLYHKEPKSSRLHSLDNASLKSLLHRNHLFCTFATDPDTLHDCNVTRIDKNSERVEYLIILR